MRKEQKEKRRKTKERENIKHPTSNNQQPTTNIQQPPDNIQHAPCNMQRTCKAARTHILTRLHIHPNPHTPDIAYHTSRRDSNATTRQWHKCVCPHIHAGVVGTWCGCGRAQCLRQEAIRRGLWSGTSSRLRAACTKDKFRRGLASGRRNKGGDGRRGVWHSGERRIMRRVRNLVHDQFCF